MQIGKEEVTPLLFAEEMVLHRENSTVSTQKPLEPINKISRLHDTRSIYRNLLCFCTLMRKCEEEKVKQIPFKTASKIT